MKNTEYVKAIEAEVERWPGVSVEFVEGGKHPKAKLSFGGKMLAQTFASTPGDAAFGVHQMLGDMRRAMKKLGATRDKPEPSKDEDEAPYRKPNDGAAKRPDPVKVEKAKPKPDVAEQLVAAGAVTAEQADLARAARDKDSGRALAGQDGFPLLVGHEGGDDEDEAAARIKAEFEARVAGIVDGIYFGLPSDVYHAVPRLSSSGIQKMCVSPATFWRGSWLDPDRPEEEDATIWMLLGRAYHVARLEPDLFDSMFVRALEKSEAPKGTVFTGVEMGKKLEDMGVKKSGSIAEQAERLADSGYPVNLIWPLVVKEWEDDRNGRSAIPAKHYDQMLDDAKGIHSHPQIGPLFGDGEAEVSVFWTDEHDVKMKSRLDWLTFDHWVDLKTFDNTRGKKVRQALADAVRYNRYYIQAPVYREAVEQIRVEGLQIIEAQTEAQRDLIARIQIKPGELACWYVFQEKGGVPNLFAYEFPFYMVPYSTLFNEQITDDMARREAVREATKQRTELFYRGQHEILQAKKEFELYSRVYEPGEKWWPIDAISRFTDEDFSGYWLNEHINS